MIYKMNSNNLKIEIHLKKMYSNRVKNNISTTIIIKYYTSIFYCNLFRDFSFLA